jgi:signal transduction histidine kinase
MPARIDLLIGLLLTVVTQVELWTVDRVDDPFWLQVVSFLLITAPVAWRRRAPLAATAVVAVGFSLQTVAGQAEVLGGFVAAILITYAVAAREDRRGALVGASLVTVGIVLSALYDPANRSFADTFGNLFLFAVVWTLGRTVRSRQRRADVAELTAREREEQARTAVRDERARIARELHDVVAHCVSVMVLHAGAARRVLRDDPQRVAEPLLLVEETGRQALAEMQRLLGILRENGARAALTPQPGLDDLPALAEQVRRSGLPVELRVEGAPRPLPAGVGLAAYRIVQEALTNALKHAGPATTSVRIAYRPHEIELEVVDDGRGGGPGSGTGHGLVGMRERAALYGGEIEAAPLEKRGFRVRARLPLDRVTA